jgi:glycerophosphoryl diester phosphodiesterase
VCSLTAILSFLSFPYVAAGRENEGDTPAARLVAAERVLVIAHRGDSQRAPENTLPAFRSAVAAGADLVELDYFHSADGRLVVFHDETLDRTTDAEQIFGGEKIPLASKTFVDLQRLDAGAWFDPRFRGVKIPTLAESLDLIQAGSVTLIERKAGGAPACIQLLREKDLLDQVVVQAFDWDYLADCHRLAPGLTLAALGKEQLTSAKLEQIENTGARAIGWRHDDLTSSAIAAAHRRGLKVWAYTVNDPARARELIAAGLDGVITDSPAVMKRLAAKDVEARGN